MNHSRLFRLSAILLLWATFVPCFAEESILQRIRNIPFTPVSVDPVEGFTAYGGTWTVDGSGLDGSGPDGSTVTGHGGHGGRLTPHDTILPCLAVGEVRTDIFIPKSANGYSGLSFKVSDSGEGADAYNGYEVGFNPAGGHFMIGAHRHNFRSLRTIPFDVPVGTWFNLRVVFTEDAFEVWLDGRRMCAYKEDGMTPGDPLRRGSIALRCWGYEIRFRRIAFRSGREGAWTTLPLTKTTTRTLPWPERFDLSELPEILVLERFPLSRPNSVGNDLWQARPTGDGCRIVRIDPARPAKPVQVVFEDSGGSIYDMSLSYDAKTVFFSRRVKGDDKWHIWKIGVDGKGLTQLTSGPYFDVSPCELPDGALVFVSTRRFGHTVCQPGPASNLFRMNADGSGMTCVSMNTLSDMSPFVLPDGRVLFTRWEYVDRDLTYRQSLWTQNPDGSGYQLYFGNTIRDVGTFWQAKPLPSSGSRRVVATFAPHHGYPQGAIGIVDRDFGVEGKKGESFVYLTREFPTIGDRSFEWSWRDPYPLDDDLFLASFGSDGPTVFPSSDPNKAGNRYRICLLDLDGQRRMVYETPVLSCYSPIPLLERDRPPVLAPRADLTRRKIVFRPTMTPEQAPKRIPEIDRKDENDASWGIPERLDPGKGEGAGEVLLINVYHGLENKVAPGTIKSLRVMEQVRKTEDLTNRAYDQSPVMSYGTYYAKRCWGTVPVEPDGSAHFYVPALREIYFQALDGQGREVQRMTSAAQFMPGESASCLGCHEPRNTIPGTAVKTPRAIAASRKPDIPKLPEWMTNMPKERANKTLDAGIVDYCSVVQPVLDRYCVECHEGGTPDGGCDLSGDKTRFFNMSYDNLLGRSRSYRQHDMQSGEMLPDQKKLGKPLVQFHWLLFTPSAVNQPYWTGSLASRLPDYFSKEHCKKDVTADDMSRVYTWIDANVPYYGTYAHTKPAASGRRDRWGQVDKPLSPWMTETVLPIYKERCVSCHGELSGGNRNDLPEVYTGPNTDWLGRYAWINLGRPENSSLLTAHLAKSAGGRGISMEKGKDRVMFTTRDDAVFQRLLHAIEEGRRNALAVPEADMPGFANARPEP